MVTRDNVERVGLPTRPFLYTLDQIANIISVEQRSLDQYLYYDRRSTGFPTRTRLLARNIANFGDKPEWRVAEHELVRWLKHKGFKFYDRSTALR